MKNFPITVNGKTYWISRAVAAVGIVYKKDETGISFLAGLRGKGCPDFNGCWNLICGYLDFDETIEMAASREVREETGLDIPPDEWVLITVNSDPKSDPRQNVVFRFITKYYPSYGDFDLSNCEPNEVEDVRWIHESEIDSYDWAFNHKELLKSQKVRKYLV